MQQVQSTIPAGITASSFLPGVKPGEVISSRFGDVVVDIEKAVSFPNGLLGMPDKKHFILSKFSDSKMQKFSILQSLDDAQLSFINLPLDLENQIIPAEDLLSAAGELGISAEYMAVLLVVSVHRSPGRVWLSGNARAPLIIDVQRKIGVQYVFQNDKYNVQQML